MKFYGRTFFALLAVSVMCKAGSVHTNPLIEDVGPEPVEIIIRTEDKGLESRLREMGSKINYSDNGLINLTIRRDELSVYEQFGAVVAEASRTTRGQYPSYTQLLQSVKEIAETGSDFTSLDTLGYTSQNRPVVQLTIGKETREIGNKPVISITGATHGNEKVGSESVVTLARELVEQYGSDSRITSVVDNYEIKIIPVLNADGYEAHQRYIPTSYNDPNREFGWQVGYYNGPDNHSVVSYPFGDKAIKLYRNSIIEDPWFISLDYHTGVEAVITPWFADEPLNPIDINEYTALGNGYVQQFPGLDKGLQFGGWMEQKGVPGVQSDYPYVKAGTIALTMEVHNSQSSSMPWDLEQVCQYNIDGFLAMAESANKGISGTVLSPDSVPLYSRITFGDNAAHVYSSSQGGSFYKYIENGSYDQTGSIFANGYKKKTVSLSVADEFQDRETIIMEKAPKQPYGALSIEYLRSYNRPQQDEFGNCLELQDGNSLLIESNQYESFILLDMGETTPATNQDGDDITIHLTMNGRYELYGSNDIDELDQNNSNNLLGSSDMTNSFDLDGIDADSLRYFKIVVPAGSEIGLDAIEAKPPVEEVSSDIMNLVGAKSSLSIVPLSHSIHLNGTLPHGEYKLQIRDLRGRVVHTSTGMTDGSGAVATSIAKPQGAGMYLLSVTSQENVKTYPLLLL